jgi:pyruvate dehydrogenase E1 component alpha subunit
MHLFDAQARLFGGNAIVGGGLPLAAGLALASQMQKENRVTACYFGEGAVAEGAFHESMNLAQLWHLPVVWFLENNHYAMGTSVERSESQTDFCVKAGAFGISTIKVDGMDVVAVHEAAKRACGQVRAGAGPIFVEFNTYRFRAHSMFDAELYRDKAEVEQWKTRGPIHNFSARLKNQGDLTEEQFLEIDRTVMAEVETAVAFAEAGTREPVEDLAKDVYAP